MHPRLYIENKQSQYHPLWTLFKDTQQKAKAEGLTPLVTLDQKDEKGFLVVCNHTDFIQIAQEYFHANNIHVRIETDRRHKPLDPNASVEDIESLLGKFNGPLSKFKELIEDIIGEYGAEATIDMNDASLFIHAPPKEETDDEP